MGDVQRGKRSPHQRFTRKRVCDGCVAEGDRVLGVSTRSEGLQGPLCERCGTPTRTGKVVEYLTPRSAA